MRHIGTAVSVVGMVGGAALVVLGPIGREWDAGVWMVVAGGSILGAAATALVLTRLALKIESNTSRLYNQTHELCESLAGFGKALKQIADNTSISEAAKSIAHRSLERDAVRGAIYEEVRREDFEGAFHLIDDLESRLGYREEAERLREEIRELCTEAFRDKLKQALEHINALFDAHDWEKAQAEIERVEKVMPKEQRVRNLRRTLEQKRAVYKNELLRSWNEEAARNNVERCLEILKELDAYLTREEAHSMQSSAREIFKERLMQLRMHFQFAVKEHRWGDALAAGLEITEEFPNSRMAAEVKDKMGALRARAGITSDIEVTARDAQVPQASEPSQ